MRKGISFTLTIIITAVVLMTAALTLVTLFGSSVGSFFGTISETGVQARVRQKCSAVARRVNDKCSEYYNDTTNEFRSFRNPPEYTKTCNEVNNGCGITVNSNNIISVAGIETQIEATVDIEGDIYNCADEGYLSNNCPVNIN